MQEQAKVSRGRRKFVLHWPPQRRGTSVETHPQHRRQYHSTQHITAGEEKDVRCWGRKSGPSLGQLHEAIRPVRVTAGPAPEILPIDKGTSGPVFCAAAPLLPSPSPPKKTHTPPSQDFWALSDACSLYGRGKAMGDGGSRSGHAHRIFRPPRNFLVAIVPLGH